MTLEQGLSRTLSVTAYDSRGTALDEAPETTWRSTDPTTVSVSSDGTVEAVGLWGAAWVYASGEGWRDSVAVWVQPPGSQPSRFNVTLVFGPGVPDRWRQEIEEAAERWEEVIRLPLPEVTVADALRHCSTTFPPDVLAGTESGVRIHVTASDGFPDDTYVEAVGGPCSHRGLPTPTTVLGEITLNAKKFGEPIPSTRRTYVAHHEMGHAFGLVGVVQGHQPTWLEPEEGIYHGHFGLYGAWKDTGRRVLELSFANGSHWDRADVMGLDDGTIKNVSIGALIDLGYPAAWYGAGPYR